MTPKILIVYASAHGQTEKIAVAIGARLRGAGAEVELADATTRTPPDPGGYDAVAIGSRVQMGKHAPSVLHYIERHRDRLSAMPAAFFSVSMAAATAGAGADPQGYLQATFAATGWTPGRAIAFAGGLPYRKYGWLMRFIMKRISAKAGHPTDTSRNHEATDWAAVTGFADAMLGDARKFAGGPPEAPEAPAQPRFVS